MKIKANICGIEIVNKEKLRRIFSSKDNFLYSVRPFRAGSKTYSTRFRIKPSNQPTSAQKRAVDIKKSFRA